MIEANPLVTPALEGARAACDEDPVSACPYRPGTPEHSEWVREWNMNAMSRQRGASPEMKAALGLAPTRTKVGLLGLRPHPNWATGPAVKVDEIQWVRPEEPLGAPDPRSSSLTVTIGEATVTIGDVTIPVRSVTIRLAPGDP